jgi:hypothetical protein
MEQAMADPWVPPYFGSYEQLLNELLSNPFLGGGSTSHPPLQALRAYRYGTELPSAGPSPVPWRGLESPHHVPWRLEAAGYLVSVLALREAAAGAGEEGGAVVRSADLAIDRFIDDYCGTVWHIPWPVPGPGPWVFGLASQLSLIANTLQQGELRNAVQNLAAGVIRKGVSEIAPRGTAGSGS